MAAGPVAHSLFVDKYLLGAACPAAARGAGQGGSHAEY